MIGKIFFFLPLLFIAVYAVNVMPPKVVYSATIRNRLDSPVQCQITWATPTNKQVEESKFIIMDGERHRIPEKLVDMGSWTGAAVIDKIKCGGMVLTAPFDGVSSPQRDWRFTIGTQGIVSVGSGTPEF